VIKNSLRVFTLFTSTAFAATTQTTLIQVPVSFQEALAPQDTTSTSRFKEEYKSAIETSLSLLEGEIKKCGYEIKISHEFYGASDPLQARERAAKAQNENTWLIVGPRRSNHYMLTSQGAEKTPSISTMANATTIFELGDLHLTLGTSNQKIAQSLTKIAKEKSKKTNPTYVSIVNEDCVFCLDLSAQFDSAANGFKKLSEIKVIGDLPDLNKITNELGTLKPDFILLPNYSKPSATVMAHLKDKLPKTFYLSGDGWGTDAFGFVQSGVNLEGAIGYSARGSIPSKDALKSFKAGRTLLKNPTAAKNFSDSNTTLAILKILEGTADILCAKKPKTRDAFISAFQSEARKYMQPTWGVGIYKLENANMSFYRVEK